MDAINFGNSWCPTIAKRARNKYESGNGVWEKKLDEVNRIDLVVESTWKKLGGNFISGLNLFARSSKI